jgi:hypothetical protein
MGKGESYSGQPLFSQLLSFLDRSRITRLAKKFHSDRYYKRFGTYHHLVTMLYATFHKCTSLREVTTGMQACAYRIQHLGMDYCPRRSTLSDANRERPSEVFEAIYRDLFWRKRKHLPDSRTRASWYSKLYIADSTTISLFNEILKNAGRTPVHGKRKGGIKVHTLMKAQEDVPCLIKMTAASKHDVPFIQGLRLPQGSIITFDKGYVDYRQYDMWTQQGVYWVTRLRQGAQHEILEKRPVSVEEKKNGVLNDEKVILGHQEHNQITRTPARMITYRDPLNNRVFQFITNNYEFDASTVALIYKHRWQIELLFKRIKQNYPLTYFLGDNENAIRIQIWCVLIADLILKLVQTLLTKRWSFGNLTSMVRIHLMSYIHMFKFLENPDQTLINSDVLHNKGPTLFTQ